MRSFGQHPTTAPFYRHHRFLLEAFVQGRAQISGVPPSNRGHIPVLRVFQTKSSRWCTFFLLRANHRIFLIKIENLRGKEIILFLELHHKISLGSYGFWLYLHTSLASEEEFVSVVIFIFEYSLRIYVAPKRHIDMSPVMARTMFVCSAHSSIKTTPHPSQSKPTHNPFFSADLYFGTTRSCANCL